MAETTVSGLPAATLPITADAAFMSDQTPGSGVTVRVAKSDIITPISRTLTVSTSTVQMNATDNVLRLNNTSGGAISVLPPPFPGQNQTCQVIDISGTADVSPISFTGTVSGQVNPVLIDFPRGFRSIRFNTDGSIDFCG